MAKEIKKEEKEIRKPGKLSRKEREARSSLYLYHKKKREAWAEFLKTPEGIEVMKKARRVQQITNRCLRKRGYSSKDLDPLRWFASK